MCQVCESMEKYGNELLCHVAQKDVPKEDLLRICGYLVGSIMETAPTKTLAMVHFMAGMAKGQDIVTFLRSVVDQLPEGFLQRLAEAEKHGFTKGEKGDYDPNLN